MVMSIDLDLVRADTPGCRERLHLNNAGASLMPRPVVETVIGYLERETRIGGYEAKEEVAELLEAVYQAAARLVHCQSSEIALLENATRAWNAAFQSIPLKRGDRIITGRAEYVSNYIALLHAERVSGVEIVVVGDDEHGQIDVRELSAALDERAKLVALTHVPTSGGLVNPAAEVGRVARNAGVPFLLDACQSVGQMPIDVAEIGCDFLSTTGRKFLRGPRGTGFLYVSSDRLDELDPPMPEVGSARWIARDDYALKRGARRFETWETSCALQLGLGRAIEYALALGLDAIWDRVRLLSVMLRAILASIPGVTIHDLGRTKCGIVTFTVEDVDSVWLRQRLSAHAVNVDVSTVEDSRLDFEARALRPMIRASVHYFNSEDEIAGFCQLVEKLCRRPEAAAV
jgi:cysteine desulfurase/selenocysteine lyase